MLALSLLNVTQFQLKILGYYLLTTTIFLLYFNTCIKYNNVYSILIDCALHRFQSLGSALGSAFLFTECAAVIDELCYVLWMSYFSFCSYGCVRSWHCFPAAIYVLVFLCGIPTNIIPLSCVFCVCCTASKRHAFRSFLNGFQELIRLLFFIIIMGHFAISVTVAWQSDERCDVLQL